MTSLVIFLTFSPSALAPSETRPSCSAAETRPTSPPFTQRNPIKISDSTQPRKILDAQPRKLADSKPRNQVQTTSTMAAAASGQSNSIVNKPARGWLHPDYLFAKDGINYNVRVSVTKC